MDTNRYLEEDFEGFVQDLLKSGRLEDSKEIGIAKRMLDKGYNSLSEKQKYVFDNMIDNNSVKECEGGDGDIPWCEMLEALDNGGYCSHCQHIWEKLKEE